MGLMSSKGHKAEVSVLWIVRWELLAQQSYWPSLCYAPLNAVLLPDPARLLK